LPNNDIGFKISGNYVVVIYEDNKVDSPIAQVCFSIVEPKVSINATIRGNTDTELYGRLQQLDFDLKLNAYPVRDVNSELKIVIRQNNRFDNEVTRHSTHLYFSLKTQLCKQQSLDFLKVATNITGSIYLPYIQPAKVLHK